MHGRVSNIDSRIHNILQALHIASNPHPEPTEPPVTTMTSLSEPADTMRPQEATIQAGDDVRDSNDPRGASGSQPDTDLRGFVHVGVLGSVPHLRVPVAWRLIDSEEDEEQIEDAWRPAEPTADSEDNGGGGGRSTGRGVNDEVYLDEQEASVRNDGSVASDIVDGYDSYNDPEIVDTEHGELRRSNANSMSVNSNARNDTPIDIVWLQSNPDSTSFELPTQFEHEAALARYSTESEALRNYLHQPELHSNWQENAAQNQQNIQHDGHTRGNILTQMISYYQSRLSLERIHIRVGFILHSDKRE